MNGNLIESEYDGYFYNPSYQLSKILKEKYNIDIIEEYEDAISQYLEYETFSSPTSNFNIQKHLYLIDNNFFIVRFKEKLSNAYI